MKFSVSATFTGIDDSGFRGYELDYMEVRTVCKELDLRFSETEKGDTDYQYLCDEYQVARGPIILAKIQDGGYTPTFWEAWRIWSRTLDVQCILTRKEFTTFVDRLGAFADSGRTLGTHGGPLSNGRPTAVPDIDFRVESPLLVECIRATPFPEGRMESGKPFDWEKIRTATIAVYGN